MRRPSLAREALGFSPLVQASGAHPSDIESVRFMPTVAGPAVFFAWRPAAEWASDARTGGGEALVLIWFAIYCDGRVVVRNGAHAPIL